MPRKKSNPPTELKPNAVAKEQRDRESENQSIGEAEIQSFRGYGETHETDDTHELPPFGVCVDSLLKAVQIALADKSPGDPVFRYARAVKAFEKHIDKRLPVNELPAAFNIWWSVAKTSLPPETDREECLYLFLDAYDKAKTPLGCNVIDNALSNVNSGTPPPEAGRYESPKLKRLVHLCSELQKLVGDDFPFFLSLRDAARAIGLSNKSLALVSAFMRGLERDQVLTPVERGKSGGKKATRYRYNRITSQ
jgi:hypothetical protein